MEARSGTHNFHGIIKQVLITQRNTSDCLAGVFAEEKLFCVFAKPKKTCSSKMANASRMVPINKYSTKDSQRQLKCFKNDIFTILRKFSTLEHY